MAKLAGFFVAVLIGALLGLTVGLTLVASQKPDAKQENLEVPSDVAQAGGDVSRVVLRYGSR